MKIKEIKAAMPRSKEILEGRNGHTELERAQVKGGVLV